jgi:hypothetical protein
MECLKNRKTEKMPDDSKTAHQSSATFNFMADAGKPQIDFPDIPPACLVMSNWSEDDWNPPENFERFPILEICPDAPAYFAQAGHFTNRDLRGIVSLMRLDADFRDPDAIYRIVLARVQEHPWVLAILETLLSGERQGKKLIKNRSRRKGSMAVSKMPLSKLRLMEHPSLHDRLKELCLPSVEADIAVAAFCEYAILNSFLFLQSEDKESLFKDAMIILTYDGPKEIVESHLGDLDDVENWVGHAWGIIQLLDKHPDVVSEVILQHATETVKQISLMLTPDVEPEDFNLVARVSALAFAQAKQLHIPRREAVLTELEKTGIKVDSDNVTDAIIAALSMLLEAGAFDALRNWDLELIDLEETVADLCQQIQTASSDEDFTLLAELAPQANEAKKALEEARKTQDRLISLLTTIVSEKDAELDALVEKVCGILASSDFIDNIVDLGDVHEFPSHILSGSAVDKEDGSDDVLSEEADADDEDVPASSDDSSAPSDTPDRVVDEVPVVEEDRAELVETATNVDDAEQSAQPETGVSPDPETAKEDPVESLSEEEATAAPEAVTDIEIKAVEDDLEIGTDPAVPATILADLIDRGLVGIAADAAEVFEAHGRGWPIQSAALRTAAASRAPHREYNADTQKFLAIASRVIGEEQGDLGSVLVLGSMIRPSIFEKSSGFRDNLSGLCRGTLGKHLQQATDAISGLDYDFPPDTDELARLSGAQRVPHKQRLATQLNEWCDAFSRKTSRWPFATAFMHHLASDNGLIGTARLAIQTGAPNAAGLARKAITQLSSPSEIEDRSVEFGSLSNRTGSRLHPKGVEYLHRQFDEPLGLLDGWVRAVEREGSQGQKSETRLRTIISNLQSRLEKAIQGLAQERETSSDPLTSAVAQWIIHQIEETLQVLQGQDAGTFATLEEALTAERDLLPAAARDALDSPDMSYDALRTALEQKGILQPEDALARALDEGAFDTATRLSERFNSDAQADIQRGMALFAENWQTEIQQRERRLKTLAKLDYKHQDEIARRLSWCEIALSRLKAIKDGSEIHDLADVPVQIADLDDISRTIEANIRSDQTQRIGQYRNEQNAEEADALLSTLDSLSIESIEDRIAQLRDGRSAATFETDLQGVISEFTPDFLSFATTKDWPGSAGAFQKAVESEGPLFIEEDRRAAGLDFIALFREITTSMSLRKPVMPKIREFFEAVGFERVKIHDFKQIGRSGAWQGLLSSEVRSVRSDDWFLPPVFGSQATGGYRLLLIGPDVLPEVITKALTSETPAILFMSGVVDTARRQELAERLRANAIPALVIDEAVVAFTATRRQARVRTIFECGLPYGRVDPYTTDAGALPPEMFFGRSDEIRHIMSKTADGCLVYGGRQLGKSALLGHVSRTRHAPEDDQIVVRRDVKSLGNSEKTSEIWTHLAGMLSPDVVSAGSRTAETVSRDIRNWIARKANGRIVCMFDEADHFMDADTRDDYPELSKLKELMEDTGRAFKVVFAGLHNVQRMHRQPNSPLAHLGEPICIGPLNRTEDDKRAAHDLVVNPMRAAGFRFESNEAVEEILAWANYYPSLVQEYMKGLLATLHGAGSGKAYKLPSDGPLWPIPSDTLFTHRGFGHIENRIREKFHLTLNLDPRYALVAYTLGRLNAEGNEHQARVTGFRTDELLDEAKIFWPKNSELPSLVAFEALLEELFDLGVLGRVPIAQTNRFHYLLGSRQVAAMLGSEEDIYHALTEIEEKDPAVAYDRSIHRRRYAPADPGQAEAIYAPLTDLQIERIVQKDAAPVQIVCGLDLLGLSKVGSSLKRISETGRLPGASKHDIQVHLATSVKDLRASVDRASAGDRQRTLVVYTPEDAKEAHTAINWLERQPRVLGGQARPLIILDAADAEMRGLASRRHEQSQFLTAWGAEMVRVHLHHIEKTDLDTPSYRDAILAASGGIPTETVKLIREMRVANDPIETAKAWKASLRIPESILKETLGQALVMLEMFEGEDYDAGNELMREHIGSDLVDIGPDLLATGLVTSWNPKSRHIRRSALGNLVAKWIEK